MNSMGFQTIGLLKFELKLQGKNSLQAAIAESMQKNKYACVRCKLVFKSDIGKYVRILRLSLGIACDVSKDNAAVGARLYSLFSPFIQLWCEPNFAIT